LKGIPTHLQQEAGPRSPGVQPPATPSPLAPSQQATAPQQTTPAATAPSSNAPVNLFEAAAQHAAAQRGGGGRAPAAAAAPAGGAAGLLGGANLEALRNNPQFQQLRQIVQTNPQFLEPIIQNIAQGNPQFAAVINQNPEAFLQLLAEGGEGEGGEEGGPLPPGAIQLSLTPAEAEAIGRVLPLSIQ
jgi:UV excision repair protein RAD23